jgi:hypothetical protein
MVTCPGCGRSMDREEGQKYCPFCGHDLDKPAAGDSTEFHPPQEPTINQDRYCPWEDQDNLGLMDGLLQTLKSSLFTPQEFFSKLPIEGGFVTPLLYALIVQTLGMLVSYAWAFSLDHSLLGATKLSSFWIILLGVLVPMFVFLHVIVSAFVLHISLFLVAAAKREFETTFRVVCYSSGPDLFSAVPVVGGAVALVWHTYLIVIGLREVHGITTARAFAAVVLPLVLCCGLILTGIAVIGIGWGLGGMQ